MTNYIPLTEIEISQIEKIWNNKIRKVYIKYKNDGRQVTRIIFQNNIILDRSTSAWRLECKLGRRLHTIRTGGDETCDHIDNDRTNDHPDNLQLLSNSNNVSKNSKLYFGELASRTIITENIVLEILSDYFYNHNTVTNLVNKYKISRGAIQEILNCRNWRHVKFEFPKKFKKPHASKKLSDRDIIQIRLKYKLLNKKSTELFKEYGTSISNITSIIRNDSWKHISIPEIYDFYISDKHIIAIPGQIIIINNIKYIFIGKVCDLSRFPNDNCIYVDNSTKIIKRTKAA